MSHILYLLQSYSIVQTSCTLCLSSLAVFRRCFNHHVTRDTFNFSRRLLSELRILSRESRWCFPCQHFHFLRVEEKEFYDLVFAGKRNERQSRPLIWLCLNIDNVLIMGACRLMTMKRLIGEFTGNRRTFPMKLAKLPGWASRRWLKTGNPPESVPLTSYLSFQSQMKLERMLIFFWWWIIDKYLLRFCNLNYSLFIKLMRQSSTTI